MFTRLYKNVLNTHLWMESAHSQCFFYRNDSLFNLHGRCHARNVPKMTEILAESLAHVDNRLSDEEFLRAKNMMKSNLLMNIESRAVQVEDVGRQSMCYGRRLLARELNDRIDSVSRADITRTKEQIMSSEPLTLVTYGNCDMISSTTHLGRLGFKPTF